MRIVFLIHFQLSVQGGNTRGRVRFRLVSASQSYDDLWRITGKSQHVSQTGLIRPGARKLPWDARNRLRALSDDGYVSLYWYDADGNRTVKERHGGEAVWVNSARAGQRTDSVVYSIYPSPYININGDHWTKHYYIGPERVASSTGKFNAGFGSLYYPGNVVASPFLFYTLGKRVFWHLRK